VHLQTLAKEPRANLLAVADIDAQAARRAGEAFGIPSFGDPFEMLDTARPEAVIICTPPNTHRSLTEAALSAGAHVLCEKPLALTVEDALAMVRAAEDKGLMMMMASKFRYVQDIIHAKGIVEEGIVGEVIILENEFCSHVDMKGRWNSNPAISGGGVLIDNGSHSVDIFRYLIGPVDNLQAVHGKRWQQIEVEDTCHLILRSTDGTTGSIDLSWSIHKEDPYFIRIFGTEGMLEIGWKGSRYRQSEKRAWAGFGSGYDKLQAVGAQLANFIDALDGKGTPMITTEDAVESVRVIQCAYHTAVQTAWEKVGE
jgi:predicted dehydrogenase